MMTQEERNQLVQFRFEQAHTAAKSAELLIENGDPRGALNRIYYGMFYAVLALALCHNFETSKHGQLIGWFNKEFVKNKVFDPRLSQILREAFERRTGADYEYRTLPQAEEIQEMLGNMRMFIAQIEDFLHP